MSQAPLNPEDVLRVVRSERDIGAGRSAPIPDLTVFRTEWLCKRDPAKTEVWSQTVHASAPGVGTFRFTWGASGGEIRAFGKAYRLQVKGRAVRGVVADNPQ